jgi:hypothetical protein
MSKLNLSKLLYETPDISIHGIKEALKTVFYYVIVVCRNEPFFNFQINCFNDSLQLKLIIRYGWSMRTNRWYFEAISARRKTIC